MIKGIFIFIRICGVASLLFSTAGIAAACDLLADGSFEAGTPNPFWAETSTNFGTPLCGDPVNCLGSPRTGTWWAFFGGKADANETGTLTQTVLIPADPLLRLKFYLWNPYTSGNGIDFLRVTVDGAQVFNMLAGGSLYTGGYTLVDLGLAPYADGGCHTLGFQGTTFASPDTTDIFVDDVAIQCPSTVRVGATPYSSVQAAMDAAGDGSLMTATAYVFTENLQFSQSGTVTFKGGFNCAFTQNTGYTTINGSVTVNGTGTLILENVIIR
jgi:hypothetical protein